MSRYNLIGIGDFFLTSDGTDEGYVCRTTVTGLDDRMYLDWDGTTTTALDGTPYTQVRSDYQRKGGELTIQVEYLHRDLLNEIIGYMEEKISEYQTTIPVTFKNNLREFAFSCKPRFPRFMEFPGTWIDDKARDVTFKFTVWSLDSETVVED